MTTARNRLASLVRRSALLALPLSVLVAGCAQSDAPRGVSGQISVAAFQRSGRTLDNPVVIAKSSDHRVFLAHVAPTGAFALQLPSGVSYRLTLANSTASRTFVGLSRIQWPTRTGSARWARLGAGSAVSLGVIHPISVPVPAAGATSAPISASKDGSDDDQKMEKDDDGEKDDADECDSDKEDDSECDQDKSKSDDAGDKDLSDDDDNEKDDGEKSCGGASPDGGTMPQGGGNTPNGGPCQTVADCQKGLSCFQNVCQPVIF